MQRKIGPALIAAVSALCLCLLLFAGCVSRQAQQPTTAPTSEPIQTSTTTHPTEPTTEVTTAPTEPTTEVTTAPTEPTTEPTTAPTTEPTTEPTQPTTTVHVEVSLNARHAFVYDVTAGQYLFIHGGITDSIAPASITKLLTAYVALQILPADQEITVGQEITLIDVHSSLARISIDDRLTAAQLAIGMVIPSGNDASYTLAVAAGRALAGDDTLDIQSAISRFMEEVNRYAADLGLVNTFFVTPDGIDADGHHTCMEDLMQIALLSMEDPVIGSAMAMASYSFTAPDGKEFTWKNSNSLLQSTSSYYTASATGMKTGHTSAAGSCLLASFDVDGRQLIVGVFGCTASSYRYDDILTLYRLFR